MPSNWSVTKKQELACLKIHSQTLYLVSLYVSPLSFSWEGLSFSWEGVSMEQTESRLLGNKVEGIHSHVSRSENFE